MKNYLALGKKRLKKLNQTNKRTFMNRILLLIPIITLLFFGCGDSEARNKDLEEHKELVEIVNEVNERIERIDFRADGNSQKSDSTRKLLNVLLVGDNTFSLNSEDNIDLYDRLNSNGKYENDDFSYFAKIDSINNQFEDIIRSIDELEEELAAAKEELESSIEDLDDELSSLKRKVTKLERALSKLEKDLKENSLIFMDPRWKDLDINLLYEEFKITQ